MIKKTVNFGIIVDELSSDLLNKEVFKNIQKVNIKFPTIALFHYINHKNKHLAPKLLKALNEMKEKKIFQKLQEASPQ